MKRTLFILADLEVPEGVSADAAVRALADRLSFQTLADGVRLGHAEALSLALTPEQLTRAFERAAERGAHE